jgi:predicted DNA binding CopG/RHH family protein
MKTVLDAYEQAIEDSAEYFVPVSDAERAEIEAIINVANKTKSVNIRLSNHDNEKGKQKPVFNTVKLAER